MLSRDLVKSTRVLPHHLRKQPEPTVEFGFTLREATARDLPEIREIYNYYVLNTVVTFDEKAMSLRAWRAKFGHLHKHGYPIIVAESPTGQIHGYALVTPWRQKSAFRYTVENSVYVRPASVGRGVGKALLTELIAQCREHGYREMIAVIADSGADGSLVMHEKFGFVEVGRMGRVGFKFDRNIGTVTMQLSLKEKKSRAKKRLSAD